jgi:hypothetical protein
VSSVRVANIAVVYDISCLCHVVMFYVSTSGIFLLYSVSVQSGSGSCVQ